MSLSAGSCHRGAWRIVSQTVLTWRVRSDREQQANLTDLRPLRRRSEQTDGDAAQGGERAGAERDA
jgi:hypothetical protein